MVDLVRHGHAGLFLFDAGLDNAADILVARIRNDGFRVIVQFLLDGADDGFQLCLRIHAELETGHHLLIALEQLDRIPAALAFLGHARDHVRDLLQRLFNILRKFMLGRELAGRQRLLRGLHQFLCPFALNRRGFHDRHAQQTGQLLHVDHIAALLHNVHHVQGHDDRNTHFEQLGG